MIDVYTGGYFQTNGYLMTLPGGGSLLVDAPEGVAAWLDSRGGVIDGLLLTHLHYDHVVDVAAIKRSQDCPVFSHSPPDPDLTLETVLKESIGWPFNLEPFEIDHLLAGESRLAIESLDLALDLHHVPGHSPDSLCFGPHPVGDESMLFGGDVLFRSGIGRTDFPHGNHELLIEGIREKIFALPDETRVLPGHGPPTTVGIERASNPFLAEF